MTARRRQIEDLVVRMENKFLESPGLKLTVPQAEMRFGADKVTCEAVLDALVDASVLCKTHDGGYVQYVPRLMAA